MDAESAAALLLRHRLNGTEHTATLVFVGTVNCNWHGASKRIPPECITDLPEGCCDGLLVRDDEFDVGAAGMQAIARTLRPGGVCIVISIARPPDAAITYNPLRQHGFESDTELGLSGKIAVYCGNRCKD